MEGQDFNSWEEVQKHLEKGGVVSTHVWTFTKSGYRCHTDCCDGYFDDIEECIDTLMYYAGENLTEIINED